MIDIDALEAALQGLIEATGYPCGISTLPNTTVPPYCVITRIASSPSRGGMLSNSEMTDQIIMVKAVGFTTSQAGAVLHQVRETVDAQWRTLSGVMGPPTYAPLGLTVEAGELGNATENITFPIGG